MCTLCAQANCLFHSLPFAQWLGGSSSSGGEPGFLVEVVDGESALTAGENKKDSVGLVEGDRECPEVDSMSSGKGCDLELRFVPRRVEINSTYFMVKATDCPSMADGGNPVGTCRQAHARLQNQKSLEPQ
eukprot:gb/GFBE01045646.1/.p1 GENE.gb/GFBE01045646.1/~~gb/GFBE01045646.1/.p1  ORF type:complete len:130 (+),score=25.21 gb/GFBE01045646.1/:1-390(+)